ncbi:metal-dependent hydrolase family protein [Caballeronia sordidicola]|uniref:Prolidase n=1 Tax=Caballeronia sordidicola TaxID=196367 RepID=A0A242MSC5_CABSO|nr:amidohydrolase family protein [Caballeronia sordidicola]OTP74122.1 Prolidase [Caballeronia sordidicola]
MPTIRQDIVFQNVDYLDVREGDLKSGRSIYVKSGIISEIARGKIERVGALVCDLKGRTLMPGLIDCHVHLMGEMLEASPSAHLSAQVLRASRRLFRMLQRGFTTVRDAGGAHAGFRTAVAQRLIPGPRLFVSGRALSQTGGHADQRSPFNFADPCGRVGLIAGFGRVADGVPDLLKAARDELRLGADQIKIVCAGGVGSAVGTLNQSQFSDEEIRAVVEEAGRSETYVMAHVYSADGIKRLAGLGVRTIEHGNLLDEDGARLMAKNGTFLVPNLVAYQSIAKYGRAQGYPLSGLAKLDQILNARTRSIELAMHSGVKIAYGSDLVKDPESQSQEFRKRGTSDVLTGDRDRQTALRS